MTPIELRASSVGVDIDGQVILDDVNLAVGPGQMLLITGPSGSGKTTLARVLGGVRMPDRGEVTIGGTQIAIAKIDDRPAFVPQDFGLVSTLTASETVSLPLQARAISKVDVRARSLESLRAVGLESCMHRPVNELSGGQRQRVAIARALAQHASFIIMDEPTAELDPANRELILSKLRFEQQRGMSLIVVSHEADVIDRASFVLELQRFTRKFS